MNRRSGSAPVTKPQSSLIGGVPHCWYGESAFQIRVVPSQEAPRTRWDVRSKWAVYTTLRGPSRIVIGIPRTTSATTTVPSAAAERTSFEDLSNSTARLLL